MTLTEIQQLRRDKPREFDALVAEKIFGLQAKRGKHPWTFTRSGLELGPLRQYGTDSAADLECHRAAYRWDSDSKDDYFGFLSEILVNRSEGPDKWDEFMEMASLLYLDCYAVGDYAAAALAAKEVADAK